MTFRIHDSDGGEVAVQDGQLHLEESRTYLLTAPEGTREVRAWLGERALSLHEGQRKFVLEIGHWAGSSELRLSSGDTEMRARVLVAPRAEKLSETAWLTMLGELEAWTPGSLVGLTGGLSGSVSHEGCSAPVLAAALLPLMPALLRAVRAITSEPQERAIERREERPLRATRRADRDVLRWLARHPEAARALDPRRFDADPRDVHVSQGTTQDTTDHPANRYVAWLISRLAGLLDDLSGALDRASRAVGLLPDTARWCQARAEVATVAADSLRALRRATFLGSLRPTPATEATLLSLVDHPLYARIHRLARPFLVPRFRREEGAAQAPLKPSFELYELWTLLATQRTLQECLGPSWRWSWRPEPGPALLAGIGAGASFEARGPGGERLTLEYNATFRGYLSRGSAVRFSMSGERRPDLVLSFRPLSGDGSWLCLDAKYRVSREALADAFSSLHLYRDSLHWEELGGSCRGGLLLVPAEQPECSPWFEPEFRTRFGIGAWRLTPGDLLDRGLGEWALRCLGVEVERREEQAQMAG